MKKSKRSLRNGIVRASEAVVTAGAPIGNKNAAGKGGSVDFDALKHDIRRGLEASGASTHDTGHEWAHAAHFTPSDASHEVVGKVAEKHGFKAVDKDAGKTVYEHPSGSKFTHHKGGEMDRVHINRFVEATEAVADQPVQCRASGAPIASSAKWQLDTPVSFQWLPGGVTTINAHFGNSSIELTVQCDEATAPIVQASYENWLGRSRQEPFGCIEHREEEAAIRIPKGVGKFEWRNDPEPGVFCTALPTELGARNVNGRIHRSWSPSFMTDADYAQAKETGGCLVFPDGVRGSASNPARVTGVAFSIGSLTNKPAFRNILPVRAKEGEAPVAEVVKAAGTSDGAKKGWEHRGEWKPSNHMAALTSHSEEVSEHGKSNGDSGQFEAHLASMKAHAKSYHAKHNNDKDYHREAAELHREAASQHGIVGNRNISDLHYALSGEHSRENFQGHSDNVNRSSSPEDLSSAIRAAQPATLDDAIRNSILAQTANPAPQLATNNAETTK